MSTTSNRPGSRWPSSTKSTNFISQPTSLLPARKKSYNPLISQQHTVIQRTAKTRHDIEQLFKLYYTNNIKFNTFQRQVVTGTRIPSAQTSLSIQNHLNTNSSAQFQSKHNVSREDLNSNLSDIHEQQMPSKRTLQVRLDPNSLVVPSTTPSLDATPMPSYSELNETELSPLLIQPDELYDQFDEISLKKRKTIVGPSIIGLPPVPSSNLTLINNRKDLLNTSHSSFSTLNSSQQTYTLTNSTTHLNRERLVTKSPLNKQQRIKSSIQHSHNFKTSPVSLQYEQTDEPFYLGARVVSIPSKCSRYVLLTFPQQSAQYKSPSYVERILLPERFPTLYNNILQNQNQK